ncbi:putative glutathione S-transferase [Helianthus annuus]|uniref:Glutathione S-transferase n=1 Tax=Helianthus annuus TaxID=4232 RepID=A0A9K3HPV1_HELAN|nr:putative glutathione S-transferase [Helianthus annuus]KAJ0875425.1 putative glutathione S-transferase [Helianthus annuus]
MATSIHLPTSFRLTVTTIKLKKLRHSPPKMSTNQTPTPTQTQLITSITKLIWGKSLPPQLLISTVRTTWSTVWHLMMSQLAPSDPSGSYTRPLSQFRTPNPQHLNPTSLHLYAALPCPWGHRTLIVRALKGLQHALPVSIASPGLDGSWEFNDTNIPAGDKKLVPTQDKVNGAKTLREVYKRRPGGAHALARNPDLDLSAPELKNRIDEWNRVIYPSINNGVYSLTRSKGFYHLVLSLSIIMPPRKISPSLEAALRALVEKLDQYLRATYPNYTPPPKPFAPKPFLHQISSSASKKRTYRHQQQSPKTTPNRPTSTAPRASRASPKPTTKTTLKSTSNSTHRQNKPMPNPACVSTKHDTYNNNHNTRVLPSNNKESKVAERRAWKPPWGPVVSAPNAAGRVEWRPPWCFYTVLEDKDIF